MARYSDVFCINCGSNKKMVYDAVISTKNRHDPDKEVSVFTNNQFGNEQLDVKEEKQLCVPSTKTLLP